MNEITQGYLKSILEYDEVTGALSWKARGEKAFDRQYAGRVAGFIRRDGYRHIRIGKQMYLAHRLIWLMKTGEWPESVDHINGRGGDNAWANLRNVNHAENHKNRRCQKNNSSGAIGVHFNRRDRVWRAYIKIGGKNRHLGSFAVFDAALAARKIAEATLGFHKNHGRTAA